MRLELSWYFYGKIKPGKNVKVCMKGEHPHCEGEVGPSNNVGQVNNISKFQTSQAFFLHPK